MEQSSSKFQTKIMQEFDNYCKTVLKNAKKDHEKGIKVKRKHEVLFSEMTEEELEELLVTDEYMSRAEQFQVLNYEVEVRDELLAIALKHLPDKKRDVILMSYFLNLSDGKIADEMNLVRTTVNYHKSSSLQKLRKIMEDITNEKEK